MGFFRIDVIKASETLPLREKVLWPGRPDMCVLAEDNELLHYGAFAEDGGEIIGIISYDTKKSSFRKLAVDSKYRRNGIGTALIQRCEEEAIERGHAHLVCHARQAQNSFYLKRGMHAHGDSFLKYKGGDLYITMRKFRF